MTISDKDTCPKCGVSLIGDPIPEENRKHYAPPYFWRREISIYERGKDRTVAFKCPDCGAEWRRE